MGPELVLGRVAPLPAALLRRDPPSGDHTPVIRVNRVTGSGQTSISPLPAALPDVLVGVREAVIADPISVSLAGVGKNSTIGDEPGPEVSTVGDHRMVSVSLSPTAQRIPLATFSGMGATGKQMGKKGT